MTTVDNEPFLPDYVEGDVPEAAPIDEWPEPIDDDSSRLEELVVRHCIGRPTVAPTAAIAAGLRLRHFHDRSFEAVFAAIVRITERGEAPDRLAVDTELQRAGEQGRLSQAARDTLLAAHNTAATLEEAEAITRTRALELLRLRRHDEIREKSEKVTARYGMGDDEGARRLLDEIGELVDQGSAAARRFVGLTHREVLEAEIPARNELVEDIVDAGTVGVIAGLPFAGKSWVAQEIAHKVAAGDGLVLGRFPVLVGGPVVYVWQDDSERNERLRIHTYAERHDEYRRDLRIRWLLNEGVRLPDDIEALRELVERESAVALVADSLYNLLGPEIELKAETVATVFAAVKHGICDPTGCTVLVVDHSPWPSESNKGQRRSYGSVFKAAAIRWGIHLETDDKDDTRLHVEAKGNNIAGLRRSPALFDPETLEIRLVDVERVNEEELDRRVLEHIAAAGWSSTNAVRKGVKTRRESVLCSLERLETVGNITRGSSQDAARTGPGDYWNLPPEATSQVVPLFGNTPDEPAPGDVTKSGGVPTHALPVGWEHPPRDEPLPAEQDEVERIAREWHESHHDALPESDAGGADD